MARAMMATTTCHPMELVFNNSENIKDRRTPTAAAIEENKRTCLKSVAAFSCMSAPFSTTLSKECVRGSGVEKFGYMAMLAFTVCGSFWLEIVLKTSVLRRWKRALLSILPISTLFLIWDAYAIAQGHWFFNRDRMLGIYGPFDIPLEEFLFFIIVPMAAILTIEGVTTVKPHLREKEFGKDEEK
jgi:lycopene cyclase domain-containing protein